MILISASPIKDTKFLFLHYLTVVVVCYVLCEVHVFIFIAFSIAAGDRVQIRRDGRYTVVH